MDTEVVVHGGFVEDAGVALVKLEDGLVAASKDSGADVNMGVEDHHEARVVLASPEELSVQRCTVPVWSVTVGRPGDPPPQRSRKVTLKDRVS